MKKLLLISAIIMLPVFKLSAQTIIPVKDAMKYKGKKITTCDKVSGSKIENGNIYLYMGEDYPHQQLTAIIKRGDRKNFKGNPELYFKGKDVCVTGTVTREKGKARLLLNSSKQIHAIMMDNPIRQKDSF